MKVIVLCEESQEVCKAFRAKGHEAFSCDYLDCSGGVSEWHIKGDARITLSKEKWDLIIAHPPCTYICNSGVRWLKTEVGRMDKVIDAANLFRVFWYCQYYWPSVKICIENPIPHKYAALPKYSQIIQPWQFGHGETKATCLWLYNLPTLKPTEIELKVENKEFGRWHPVLIGQKKEVKHSPV